MDLIDDLESDIAIAFLVERRHHQRINTQQARELMVKIVTELKRTASAMNTADSLSMCDAPPNVLSH